MSENGSGTEANWLVKASCCRWELSGGRWPPIAVDAIGDFHLEGGRGGLGTVVAIPGHNVFLESQKVKKHEGNGSKTEG